MNSIRTALRHYQTHRITSSVLSCSARGTRWENGRRRAGRAPRSHRKGAARAGNNVGIARATRRCPRRTIDQLQLTSYAHVEQLGYLRLPDGYKNNE